MKNGKSGMMSDLRRPRTKILMGLFLGTLVLVVVNLLFVNIYSAQDQIYIQETSDLRVLSQELAKHAAEVTSGSDASFAGLHQARDAFDTSWKLINLGQASYVDSGIGHLSALPARSAEIDATQPQIAGLWNSVNANAALVLSSQHRIQALNQIASAATAEIPRVQLVYEELVNTLLDNNEPLATISVAQRQTWLAERIALNLNLILSGNSDTARSLDQLQRDISLFVVNHEALTSGDASLGVRAVGNTGARASLRGIADAFDKIEESANAIVAAGTEIISTATAVDAIVRDTGQLLTEMTALSDHFTAARGDHWASPFVGYMSLLAILVLISLYGVDMITQSRRSEKLVASINQRNSDAIMKLLDEISDLADGDLTVNATVGEEFTGAIADAMNHAISQLRALVTAITNVSVEVADSTRRSAQTVKYLSEASERQTQSIGQVSESVRDMERSISDVADNAQKSLTVAKDSVAIAAGGADVVKNTIRGMDTIREQIQDTARRIKRLGESSQEIGGFVSLINDISDHTNTLSLNAAIQAAMAGEAGRGFAVVADEVHALAERSSDATRQIETLVRVIQRDINEAVFSMEKTTSDVVHGTKLAQNAGMALDDIERVSRELASIVENIAEAARNQRQSAAEITATMGTIQEITTETYSGTRNTSDFIIKLTDLTGRLRNAVAGFSLAATAVKESDSTEIVFEESEVFEFNASAKAKESPPANKPEKRHQLAMLTERELMKKVSA